MFQLHLFHILSLILVIFFTGKNAFRVKRMVQSVAVRGALVCGSKPAIGVRVKLFEHDANILSAFSDAIEVDEYLKIPNHDDVLNETYTDQEGRFLVHGTAVEVSQIEPIVKVYHDCFLNGMPGKRKIHFLVPPHFTNYGTHAERILDIGIFNLEVILPDEQYEKYVS